MLKMSGNIPLSVTLQISNVQHGAFIFEHSLFPHKSTQTIGQEHKLSFSNILTISSTETMDSCSMTKTLKYCFLKGHCQMICPKKPN